MSREELSRQMLVVTAAARRVACVFAAAVGFIGVIGFAYASAATASVVPVSEPVSASAAVCFVILAAVIWLQGLPDRSDLAGQTASTSAVVVALVSIFDLGHFALHPRHWVTTFPGVILEGMAPVTAAIMLLLAAALITLHSASRFAISVAFATAAAIATLVVLFGYAFRVVSFSSPDVQIVPERASVGALLALSVAVLLLKPARGWVGLALSATPAGTLLRVFAPATLLLPIAIEVGRRWMVDTRLVSRELSSAIASGAQVLILSSLAVGAAFLLRRRDEARRVADQERRRLEAQAATHQHSLEEAQRIAHIGNWTWDLRTNAITWSDEQYRIFGFPPSSPIDFETMMSAIHPDDRATVMRVIDETIASRSHAEAEHRIRTTGGGERIVLERGEVEIGPDGQPLRLRGTTQDVTKERRTQQALQAAEERFRTDLEELVEQRTRELAAANRELETFSYSVSHDLRAPLRSIEGFSRLLLEDADQLPPRTRDHLSRIRRATKTMQQLIDDMLSLSRITRQELQMTTIDLSGMVRWLGAELAAGHPDRSVELVVENGLTARADPGLLAIALQNLLGNAWKFTSKKPAPRVEFGSVDADGQKTFFVRDNGAGFDSRYAGKLFAPFQRLHHASEFEGTGIGLATVLRILHRHGGTARAEGTPDQGATIYFTLGPV